LQNNKYAAIFPALQKGCCKRDAYICLGSSGTLEPAGDMFISKRRKKLEPDPNIKIVVIRGKGYKLEVSA
jgi:hypothetical protein